MKGPDDVREMLRALRAESDARRSINGGERTELFGGRRINSADGLHTYRFLMRETPRARRFREAVHVVVNDLDMAGAVTAVEERGRIEISLSSDLGATVPFATLVQDDSYLTEALRDRLRAARRGMIAFNWAIIDALLAPGSWTSSHSRAHLPAPTHRGLNPEQALAVKCMSLPGVTVIWGPPGTGKTHVVGAGAAAAWRGSRRIFLLAHTNVAVDNLLERFLDELEVTDLADGAVIRVGEIVSDSLRARFGERVGYDTVVKRRRAPLDRELERLGGEIASARSRVRAAEGLAASDVEAASVHLDALNMEAARLEREHEGVPIAVLNEAIVVATTIHRAYLPGNLRGQADLVVVDEASMVPLPMAVYAAGLARESVVFAGDPKQLGVIMQSRDSAVRRWVAASVFQIRAKEGEKPHPILLREQYRMHDQIARMLNHVSYRPGTLITPPAILRRPPPDLCGLQPGISLVDTSSLLSAAVVPRGTRTRVNAGHAEIVASLLENVLGPGSPVGAAVITPYWGQARRICKALPSWLGDAVSVDTVHRFQGDERPLVVLDIADGAGAPLSTFMRARTFPDDGARLLTVGLSRAQFFLIVVANVDYLLRKTPSNAFVRRVLAYLREHAAILNPQACCRPRSPISSGTRSRRAS